MSEPENPPKTKDLKNLSVSLDEKANASINDPRAFDEVKQQKNWLQRFWEAEDDRLARKIFAPIIFILMVAWTYDVHCIVWNAGQGKIHLGDNVLIAIITTGSLNVLSIFYYVVKYLYHPPGGPTK